MTWTKTVPPEDSRWYWMLLTKAHHVPCAGKRFPVQVKHRNGGVAWLRDMSGWLAPAPYYLTERGAFFSDEPIPEPVPEPGEETDG